MLAIAPLYLSSSAQANVFQDVQGAVADVLESDNATAGMVLGAVAMMVMLLITVFALAASKQENPFYLSLPVAFGVILAVGVGWWPAWTVLFIALIIMLWIVTRGSGGSSG
jgi:hypothetical protein